MSNHLFSDFFSIIRDHKKPTKPIEFSFKTSTLAFNSDELASIELDYDVDGDAFIIISSRDADNFFWDFEASYSEILMRDQKGEICFWGGGDDIGYHSPGKCDCDTDN